MVEYGILNKKEENYYVNEKNVINDIGICDDIVYIEDNKVIGIKERSMKKIIGILYLDSKIKYGSIKDKTYYLFKATNKKYGSFYVPYKNNGKNYKIYVIIEFKEWNIQKKMPIGILIEVIGAIDILENELEHLRIFYDIKNNIMKVNNDKLKHDQYLLEDLQQKNYDYEVFSIDPYGSKDIDDAFHFIYNDDYYEVGIHIACPYLFFKNELSIIMERVSTVYNPIRKYNMLPNMYADEMISLLEGKNRYALSCIFKIDAKTKEVIYDVKKTIVKNIKNYDYDQFDKIFKYNDNLQKFFDFSKVFFEDSFDNSHKLVENWMIYTNKMIAKYLISFNISNLILRTHIGNDDNNLICDELSKYLKICNEKSAIYEIYDPNKIQTHSKLNNDYYTHFTSPIRRSVDFFIHGLILNRKDLIEKNDLIKIIDHINIFTKNCKKFDRASRRIKFLYDAKKLDHNIETYGYIIKMDKNKLTVYIPAYNLEEKIIIVPFKFECISNFIIEDNYGIYNIDGNQKKYKLYDKINIKLWIFTSFENIFDKLKIEII